MAGNKLFNPSDSLSIRGPLDNGKQHGNVENPPRMAEFGGLDSTSKAGIHKNMMSIRPPGSTLRKVPVHGSGGGAK